MRQIELADEDAEIVVEALDMFVRVRQGVRGDKLPARLARAAAARADTLKRRIQPGGTSA